MYSLKPIVYILLGCMPAFIIAVQQTNERGMEVSAYEPVDSCLFKAGAFLRFRETITRPGSQGLDAYVVSCSNGYYKLVTRKYVPGEKTLFAQNKNIPHYILSESTSPRSNVEKEYLLNEDYKAGKKINGCSQCGGIGAEYYAEQLVNGRRESVNVTKSIKSLPATVVVVKATCSKCFGDGWVVKK